MFFSNYTFRYNPVEIYSTPKSNILHLYIKLQIYDFYVKK